MYLSLNIVQYFPHSLTKLSNFCVIGPANCRVTNVLWVLKIKEQCRKHRKRMNNSLKKIFLDPSLVSAPYLPHFSSVLRDLKHMGASTRDFQSSLYSGGKDATIQKFKLKILICFNWPIIRHWTSLHQTPPYHPHSFMELNNLYKVGSARWRVTNGLWNSEAEKQCLRIQPPLSS